MPDLKSVCYEYLQENFSKVLTHLANKINIFSINSIKIDDSQCSQMCLSVREDSKYILVMSNFDDDKQYHYNRTIFLNERILLFDHILFSVPIQYLVNYFE